MNKLNKNIFVQIKLKFASPFIKKLCNIFRNFKYIVITKGENFI